MRTTSGENGLECFAVGRDGFFGGALAQVYEHVEGHRNEPAIINDLALTLRFETGLVRNISSPETIWHDIGTIGTKMECRMR